MKGLSFTRVALIVSLFICGCGSQESLQPLEQLLLDSMSWADVNARFCVPPSNQFRQKLKYIFVIDKSSSNSIQNEATDPNGFRRYAPLEHFVGGSPDDPGYTYYSMINFSDSANILPITNGIQGFSDVRQDFLSVIQTEWSADGPFLPHDVGFTNYLAAFGSVQNLIQADADQERNALLPGQSPISLVYTVVFISDGYPRVADPTVPGGSLPQVYVPDIQNAVNSILALKSDIRYQNIIDQIVIHTGYYYNSKDAAAEVILGQIAAQGRGDAYQFGAGVNIDFTLFAVPVRSVRLNVSDAWAESMTGMWWDNGKFLRDNDEDGLPNRIEAALGSDPDLVDSDGNGVSDLVEYRSKGRPCNDSDCSALVTLRDNYPSCQGMAGGNAAGIVTFGDSDGDGLNDCEEWVLRTDRYRFDTNGDFIPDFTALRNLLPMIVGGNAVGSDSDADGVRGYDEIKRGSPTFISNSDLLEFTEAEHRLVAIESDNDESCFELRVSHLPVVGPDNNIRVTLIFNSSIVDDKPVRFVANRRLDGFSHQIEFSKEEFQ